MLEASLLPSVRVRSVFEFAMKIVLDDMHKHFSRFGELIDCVLMQDKGTGKSRGFGFITYKEPESLDKVLAEDQYLDGKKVEFSLLAVSNRTC